MLLILNLIVDRKPRDYFNEVISKRIFGDMEIEFQVDYLKEQDLDLSGFSHLLLTGSELSASKENGIDEKLYNVINHFTQNKKSILGICYGHQMLAKALHGEGTCCRAEKPEFGWKKIEITENPLFNGIKDPVFLESRYDEVCNLGKDFNIIAKNESCEIQAFQYKDKPIWGIQFHPEFIYEDGSKALTNHLNENPADRIFYKNELDDPDILNQNLKIFRNFLLQ